MPDSDKLLYPASVHVSIEHIKGACARLIAGSRQGTGYLVCPDRMITCAHVVEDLAAGDTVEVHLYGNTATLTATVERVDAKADWALLLLAVSILDRHCLPLGTQVSPEARWLAFGFPAASGIEGILLGGAVRDPMGKDAYGAPGLQLFGEEAAAARGALLHGASGSPVVCSGRVVGHLRRILPDDEDRAQLGMIFACPAAAFANQLPALHPKTFRAPALQSEYDPLWYINRRDREILALNKLHDPGVPVTLQAPQGYGKTWMLRHLLERLHQQDLGRGEKTEVVRFNLRRDAAASLSSIDGLLTSLLISVLTQLQVERVDVLVARASKLPGDSKRRFRRALEQHVFSRQMHRFVLVIEEGDYLYGSESETDFFSLLRAMVEDTSLHYQRLRVIVTVGMESGFLETTNHSAFFNLSPPIVLDGFTLSQLRNAATLYGLAQDDPGLESLHRLTAGHPHYCRLALYEVVCGERSLSQLLASIDARGGPFASALQRLRSYVEREGLKPVLRSILDTPRYNLPPEQYLKLYRPGLVCETSPGEYQLRFPLFEDYFRALCR